MREIGIGLAVGAAVAGAAVLALERVRLSAAGLYPVASLAAAAIAYGGADALHGSGFLAVYLAGLGLGSVPTPAQRTIAGFHDGLAWIAQLTLFLVLGLLVFPSQLGDVALEGTVLAVIVAVAARPAAAFLATIGFGFSVPERLVLGWAGLRGAVPVVLATFPVIAGVPHSREFFDIVFFAVILSATLQGATFEAFARRLGVTSDAAAIPAPLMESGAVSRLGAEVVQFRVQPGGAAAGRLVRELELPRDALLNLVVRDGQALPPRGSTRVEAGDDLHLLVRQEVAVEFQALLRRWRNGPLGPRPPRAPVLCGATVFTSRPAEPGDGDPARPSSVNGIGVREQLRTRRDRPGALVALADGRFSPARDRSWPSGRRVSSRRPPGAACTRPPTPSRPGGGRSSGLSRCAERR